jgi:putative hydrolase of the HAD superfamily
MPKTVLFDLDDTIYDHLHASRCGAAALHREHPHFSSKTLEELCREQHRLLNEVHGKVLQGLLTKDQARAERWRRLTEWCGGTVTDDEANALAGRYRAVYQENRRAIPGVIALLECLKGRVTVGIVTNNLTAEQKGKLRHLKVEGLMDFMVTSEEIGEPKPGRAIFEAALNRAECRPEEAVMIGDSWEVDVLGAIGAGIRPLWFNPEGFPCPDPSHAGELRAYEPLETAWQMIFREDRKGTAQ